MLRILFIFALSMSLPCQGVTFFKVGQCDRMTFSDALPVQFWLQECETFNEHEAQGVHHVCWCQPWNCDDEIVVQFTDSEIIFPILLAKYEDGIIVTAASFDSPTAVGDNWCYTTSFYPINEGLCGGLFQLLTMSNSDVIYSGAVSDWSVPGSAWAYRANNRFRITGGGGAFGTARDATLTLAPNLLPGNSISFSVTFEVLTVDNTIELFITLQDSLNNTIAQEYFLKTNTGSETRQVVFTVPEASLSGAKLQVVSYNTFGGNIDANIYLFAETEIDVPPLIALGVNSGDVLGKSDCLDIQTSHDETILINYSNHRNFAGLVYPDVSPDISFNIRVPCRFFHEVELEEDEAMELTSSILTTSAQVKTQRLLEVKHAPYYFHKKLRRVLKHQSVTIFDKAWKKEEKYEVNEGRKTWPLKSATCLLTEKNSVVRNIL